MFIANHESWSKSFVGFLNFIVEPILIKIGLNDNDDADGPLSYESICQNTLKYTRCTGKGNEIAEIDGPENSSRNQKPDIPEFN